MTPSKKYKLMLLLSLLAVNVFAFLVHIHKGPVFWLSYGFVTLAVLCQYLVLLLVTKKPSTITSRVYSTPIVRIGVRYFVFTLIFAIAVIVCDQFVHRVPYWIPCLVYIIATIVTAIRLIAADMTKDYVLQKEDAQQSRTVFMKRMTADAFSLKSGNSDPEMKEIIEKIYEDLRYSDPVSPPGLEECNADLTQQYEALSNAISAHDKDLATSLYARFHQQLERRNAMCKTLK